MSFSLSADMNFVSPGATGVITEKREMYELYLSTFKGSYFGWWWGGGRVYDRYVKNIQLHPLNTILYFFVKTGISETDVWY